MSSDPKEAMDDLALHTLERPPSHSSVRMTCVSENDLLSFIAGCAAPLLRGQVEAHLDGCARCRFAISALVRTSADVSDGSHSAEAFQVFRAGEVLAERYEIVALLGAGGMGEVYEALDLVLGVSVALKTVAIALTRELDRAHARLKAEVHAARLVTHRNVCRVFDVGSTWVDDVEVPFFTMELLRGETLRALRERAGTLSWPEVRPLAEQMAEGLKAAHDAGVIHRDLKSDNVMLLTQGGAPRLVIMDFGLARLFDGEGSWQRSNRPRSLAGTFGYIAPEILAGQPPTCSSDVYAMGVILFELLTGILPVGAGTWDKTKLSAPPLRSFLSRCLASAAAERLADGGAVARALPGVHGGVRVSQRALPHGRFAMFAIAATVATGLLLAQGRASSPHDHGLTEREAPPPLPLSTPPAKPDALPALLVGRATASPGALRPPARHKRSSPPSSPQAVSGAIAGAIAGAAPEPGPDELVFPFTPAPSR